MNKIEIYCDGACKGNPGPGGWGVLLKYGEYEKELYGNEKNTTNNRMELTAAIMGLEFIKKPSDIIITSDSEYLRQGITSWIKIWKENGWKTSDRKPVKNQDLWKRLDIIILKHDIEWKWVKGHSGHTYNERADQLANKGISELNNKPTLIDEIINSIK